MGGRSKQKACFACVEAKRRCDKTLPSCSRCLDKEIDCIYLLPQRTRRYLEATSDIWPPLWSAGQIDIPQAQGTQGTQHTDLVDPASTTGFAFASSSSLSSSVAAADHSTVGHFTSPSGDLAWFLAPSAWTIAYHYQPPAALPPAPVFKNFIRGLQAWLVCFLQKGHNAFIHRHLYSETDMPRCMQDAYSAIAITQTVAPENEHLVDAICSSHITNLLAYQPTDDSLCLPLLSTKERLARTQALLTHIILALFSPSISRQATAEGQIETLLLWTRRLWESAALDATTNPFLSIISCRSEDNNISDDLVPNLYQAFVLYESVRRTWLLSHLVAGVFYGLKSTWLSYRPGDIHITTRAELWDAPSPARWEAVARHADPLFIQSLRGQCLVARGVRAAQVDEFARHAFTVIWGLEKVENWVIRTGDEVIVMY